MSDNTELTTMEQKEAETEAPVIDESKSWGSTQVKDIGAVGEDHQLVQEIGRSALETQSAKGAGEFLSDFIYESDKAWPREWLQNHETACIRRCKDLIRHSPEYPEGWLTITKFVDAETGETVASKDDMDNPSDVRVMEVPRPISEVVEAARTLGYDPTITFDVFLDARRIITEDNGIGMTPVEFAGDFNTIFQGGNGDDEETGGMFGVGSESSALVHGKDGGMEVETRSIQPSENGGTREGFRAYSYLGGANALPGEVEDGFFGTRFKLPVQDSFDLSNLQSWIEDYTEQLRIPVLYREHDAGATPVEEEYEASNFIESYDDPEVVVDRPGEFSVVAGPDVIDTSGYGSSDDEDTFLVSIAIDRNTRYNIKTFWDCAIQLHDEQSRIVAGPHRGFYHYNNKVYRTTKHEDQIAKLHDDDVPMPQPTGDRDRLKKSSETKRFFAHVQETVKSKEVSKVSKIAERMEEADHPAEAIRGKPEDWNLFKKMVNYHGHRRVLKKRRKFEGFMNQRDELPDFDDESLDQLYGLFNKIEHCHRSASSSTKKRRRREMMLGELLKNDPGEVYMAASTGGNFTKYWKVAKNTHDDVEIIVVSSSKYTPFKENFGFKKLKNVPLKQDDDHDYDVPDSIHRDRVEKGKKFGRKSKAEKVEERNLKIRSDGDSSSIDQRTSIKRVRDRLNKGKRIGGHDKLILFGKGKGPNISDHYGMADYAAIACVSKKEREQFEGVDNVVTIEEYKEWSRSTLIATEDGAMTPEELVTDDRLVVLTYQPKVRGHATSTKLLGDDMEGVRERVLDDVRDQIDWLKVLDNYDGGYHSDDDPSDVDEAEKRDTLYAVAGKEVLDRAQWVFNYLSRNGESLRRPNFTCLRLSRSKYERRNPSKWYKLSGSLSTYKLMDSTPKWEDGSKIYDMMPSSLDDKKAQLYLGFHDLGIDPAKKSGEELRETLSNQ
jgi:hypothetical protein